MKFAQWLLVLVASLGVLAQSPCALFDQIAISVNVGSNPDDDRSDERDSPVDDDNDKGGEKEAKFHCTRVRHASQARTFDRPLRITAENATHLPCATPIARNHLLHRNSPLRC